MFNEMTSPARKITIEKFDKTRSGQFPFLEVGFNFIAVSVLVDLVFHRGLPIVFVLTGLAVGFVGTIISVLQRNMMPTWRKLTTIVLHVSALFLAAWLLASVL